MEIYSQVHIALSCIYIIHTGLLLVPVYHQIDFLPLYQTLPFGHWHWVTWPVSYRMENLVSTIKKKDDPTTSIIIVTFIFIIITSNPALKKCLTPGDAMWPWSHGLCHLGLPQSGLLRSPFRLNPLLNELQPDAGGSHVVPVAAVVPLQSWP